MYWKATCAASCWPTGTCKKFRALVRSAPWQAQLLARPLAEREAIARQMRERSVQHQHADGYQVADIDPDAAIAWLRAARAGTLIHGHTHHPVEHALAGSGNPPLRRVVLADWHMQDGHLRAQVLRLDADGLLQRLPLAQA